MKIASWNVNSIKARATHVKTWLEKNRPDILMVQELKGETFPTEEFEALGYHCAFVGQKAYNGVATFSLHPIEVIADRLDSDASDEQARYLETRINGIRVINIYLPNGNPVDSDKYPYKLGWIARLEKRLADLRASRDIFLIAGDFNVIPADEDCHDPKVWAEDALFRLETRIAYRRLLNLGLVDAFRALNSGGNHYTFWDYQAGAWPANKGIRIDHILLSPPLADRLQDCFIDQEPRGWDKPSDHTPILAVLA